MSFLWLFWKVHLHQCMYHQIQDWELPTGFFFIFYFFVNFLIANYLCMYIFFPQSPTYTAGPLTNVRLPNLKEIFYAWNSDLCFSLWVSDWRLYRRVKAEAFPWIIHRTRLELKRSIPEPSHSNWNPLSWGDMSIGVWWLQGSCDNTTI